MEKKREELRRILKSRITMQDYNINNNNKNLVINNYEIINMLCEYGSDEQIDYLYNYLNNDETLKSANIKSLLKLIGSNIFNFAIKEKCLLAI